MTDNGTQTTTVAVEHISASIGLDIVTRCVAYAGERGWSIAASVCDAAGTPLALLRSDDVVLPAIEFAIDKAYTAATLRQRTDALAERAMSRPALGLGLGNRSRILVFPGGVPIMVDGKVVGGLGVSGATDEDDIACATAVLQEMGF